MDTLTNREVLEVEHEQFLAWRTGRYSQHQLPPNELEFEAWLAGKRAARSPISVENDESRIDRELMELAAKASGLLPLPAGKELDSTRDGGLAFCGGGEYIAWDPLTDDGDALRLAMKLHIGTDCYVDEKLDEYACAWINHRDVSVFRRAYEPYGTDPLAATRRAIVRAAAEIGRVM
jgi:hypothetical protein